MAEVAGKSSFAKRTDNRYNNGMNATGSIWRLDRFSWGMYDFANTIYSMNILSLYFAGWLVLDLGYRDIHYSIAHSASMLMVAILMPALGYFSDRPGFGAIRRRFLLVFTIGAVGALAVMSFIPAPLIAVILILFCVSNFFYEGGMVFYNALLGDISEPSNVGKISGMGVSLGYLGSIVGMILVLPFVTGDLFGFEISFISGSGKSGAFLPTAVLFGLFAIPLFLFVKEKPKQARPVSNPGSLSGAYKSIAKSIRSTEKYPGLLRFLVSDFFFEDAISTVIIFMAIFTERVLGMNDSDRTLFFITSTLFAMIGAFVLGHLADRLSPKRVLFAIVSGWIIALLIVALNSSVTVFWILGPIIGILLGGVWAVSRPLLMELSPPEKLGEFFGLFSLSGRAAAIIGPLVWGGIVYLFSTNAGLKGFIAGIFNLDDVEAEKIPYRLAILALALMMVVGLWIFRKVPDRGRTK